MREGYGSREWVSEYVSEWVCQGESVTALAASYISILYAENKVHMP